MASPFWQNVLRFDASRIDSEIAIRNTIGIVVTLIVGAAFGNMAAGVVGALGALNVCYSDSQDPYAIRARRMLQSNVLVAIAVVAGALSAVDNTTAVAVAVLWAFACGMLVALGSRAGDLGVVVLATLLIFGARALSPLEAVESGLVAFAGGIVQILLSLALWPVHPWQPERRTIAAMYQAVAQIAILPPGSGDSSPVSGALNEAQETAASLAQRRLGADHSAEPERLSFLLHQSERIRLSLLSLRRTRSRIAREPDGEALVHALDRLFELAADILDSIGRSASDGHGVPTLVGLENAVTAIRSCPLESPLKTEARHQTDVLAGQLRAASGLTLREPRDIGIPGIPQNPLGSITRLRANLSLDSAAFRHAVRLTAAVGIGDAIARSFSLQRGYWVPMTAAIVLKPDFTATFSRGVLRIAGTLVGLAFATVLFHILHLGTATDIALVALFALFLRWAGPANYGLFVIAISGIAVLLIAITGVSPQEAIMARGINTIMGGTLALLVYRIWPTWERKQSAGILAALLDSYAVYFRHVLAAHQGDSPAALDSLRLAARLARSNAEASVARVESEPGASPGEIQLLHGILVSSHTFVRALMAIESGIYSGKAGPISPQLGSFSTDIQTTLAALSAALSGHEALGPLPDLREAWDALYPNPGQTLVETETDRLTTSLNTLREQVTLWIAV